MPSGGSRVFSGGVLSKSMVRVMASTDDILQTAIIGLPRVAEKIVKLPQKQRQKAFEAVEQSYLQTVIDSDHAEGDARHLVGAVMDTLRAEVADQARKDAPATVGHDNLGHDNFASLERIMKLLVNTASD